MRKALLAYLVLINAFCFVVAAADLSVPWISGASPAPSAARAADTGLTAVSALGGAAGTYGGLALAGRLGGPADEHLRRALLILMGQNAAAVLLAYAALRRRRGRGSAAGGRIPAGERSVFAAESPDEFSA